MTSRAAAAALTVLLVGLVDYLVLLAVQQRVWLIYAIPWQEPEGSALGEGLYLAGCLGRLAVYLILGAAVAFVHYRINQATTRVSWAALAVSIAGVSWTFWLVMDPTALAHVLAPDTWIKIVRGVERVSPAWGEIYTGWGYIDSLWWLVTIHAGLVLVTASVVLWILRPKVASSD